MGVVGGGKGFKEQDEERMNGSVDGQVVMTTGLLSECVLADEVSLCLLVQSDG